MNSSRAFEIDGIVPIIPTPFDAEQRIAWDELPALIDFAVGAGACAICLPAYASEFYKLTEEERAKLVSEAVRVADRRIPVVGQANHPHASAAAAMASSFCAAGATAISVAVPRLFALPERDLYRYFTTILKTIDAPLIIQDFNPGGPTINADLITRINAEFPHFRYVKLEEPLMGAKVQAVLRQTSGKVGVIQGWGGMYTLELVRSGICGIMPSLGLTDLLGHTFRLAREGKQKEAYEVFQGILPQIVYSLQNLELYHHWEKRLLRARGVLRQVHVRDAGLTLEPDQAEHLDFLNERAIELLTRLGMPVNYMA